MIPPNLEKMIAKIAATIKAIGAPLKAFGTGEKSNFSLIIEKMYITNKKPSPMKVV
jgi:hypothetical protein